MSADVLIRQYTNGEPEHLPSYLPTLEAQLCIPYSCWSVYDHLLTWDREIQYI